SNKARSQGRWILHLHDSYSAHLARVAAMWEYLTSRPDRIPRASDPHIFADWTFPASASAMASRSNPIAWPRASNVSARSDRTSLGMEAAVCLGVVIMAGWIGRCGVLLGGDR